MACGADEGQFGREACPASGSWGDLQSAAERGGAVRDAEEAVPVGVGATDAVVADL